MVRPVCCVVLLLLLNELRAEQSAASSSSASSSFGAAILARGVRARWPQLALTFVFIVVFTYLYYNETQLFPAMRPHVRTELVDSGWWVCLDKWADWMAANSAASEPCIVYSVGINRHYSFDLAMAGLGCQVYAFDPSIPYPTGSNFMEHSNIHFYQVALSSRDEHWDRSKDHDPLSGGKSENYRDWVYMTIPTIMSRLGHRHIDYLKVDVEGGEWDILNDLLANHFTLFEEKVRALSLEIHFFDDDHEAERQKATLHRIRERLALWRHDENIGGHFSQTFQRCCHELYYLTPFGLKTPLAANSLTSAGGVVLKQSASVLTETSAKAASSTNSDVQSSQPSQQDTDAKADDQARSERRRRNNFMNLPTIIERTNRRGDSEEGSTRKGRRWRVGGLVDRPMNTVSRQPEMDPIPPDDPEIPAPPPPPELDAEPGIF